MPVFDFECGRCRKKFSELVLGAEQIICPHCGGGSPRKLFSPFYTISDTTRLETSAADLPTMAQWEKARRTDANPGRGGRQPRQPKTRRLTMRDLKPRAAISRAAHKS